MPFDHNDHYHRLLLRQLPPDCRAALDVGCGTGRFARRLARRGVEVDAMDPSPEAIAAAHTLSGWTAGDVSPRFVETDVTEAELTQGHYDFISCLASIHHMPFGTVSALRAALAPGGVLVILGCYKAETPLDWMCSVVAVPINAVARLVVAAVDRFRPASAGLGRAAIPVRQPSMSLSRIRLEAASLLPGCRVRRLLFWRYLLVFRNAG